jgi:hypothetical protein
VHYRSVDAMRGAGMNLSNLRQRPKSLVFIRSADGLYENLAVALDILV